MIGIILEIFEYSQLPKKVSGENGFINKILEVKQVLNQELFDFNMLHQEWFLMLQFIKQYYHSSLGEVLRLAVPKMIKNGTFLTTLEKRALKNNKSLKLPLLLPQKVDQENDKKDYQNKVLTLNEQQQKILNYWKENSLNSLNSFNVEVLLGVTGSGKTALIAATILHFIEQHQNNNQKTEQKPPLQILIMVPEIGLTPQLAKQLTDFLQHPILLLHSQISELQRFAMWQEVTSSNPQHAIQIIVGTRLSILTPLPHLALIIIDEEHDASFKQQEGGIPYCAKKVALWLAQKKNIPVILSSATPSLETYYFAKNKLKKYHLNHLNTRYFSNDNVNYYEKFNNTNNLNNLNNSNSATTTSTKTVTFVIPKSNNISNVSQHLQTSQNIESIEASQSLNFNPNINVKPLSLSLSLSISIQHAIFNSLKKKAQVLVLHPRRGFSPVLQCGQCSWIPKCPACETALIVHRQPYWTLRCHRCERQQKIPTNCHDCGNQELSTVGRATQKIEDELEQLIDYYYQTVNTSNSLCSERPKLVRIDSDSTSSMKKREVLFAQAHHEADILLGTQMISKGHDFANVGTIIILDVDALLLQPFLKSQERLFSLLLQTMGRGGRRAQQQTQIFIETNYQEQPVFQYAIKEDVTGFLDYLLAEREAFQLPPFSYQAKLKLKHSKLEVLTQVSEMIYQRLKQSKITVFPPFSLAKQGYDYQMNIHLQSLNRQLLHQLINQNQSFIDELIHKKGAGTLAIWDIDSE